MRQPRAHLSRRYHFSASHRLHVDALSAERVRAEGPSQNSLAKAWVASQKVPIRKLTTPPIANLRSTANPLFKRILRKKRGEGGAYPIENPSPRYSRFTSGSLPKSPGVPARKICPSTRM